MQKIVLSGVQTTGHLHLGNYLGSINNWLMMQESYNCFFFLADLHSITIDRPPQYLRSSILSTIATYLACGIDAEKSTIFLQSDIKEHSELAWILNCVTPLGWLKRMTQFKDKASKNIDNTNTGLFTYPLLMAADILIYEADLVPVGDDQKQHLELTRDIAGIINRKFGVEVLRTPEPLIQGNSKRVMSLRDGRKKMSKSDISEASRIHIMENPDSIIQKIKKSKTDSIETITYDPENRPEVTNLINIYSSLSKIEINDIIQQYTNLGFAKFKKDLAYLIIEHFASQRAEYFKLLADSTYLKSVLEVGAQKARVKASSTLSKVKKHFGFF